MKAVWYERYGSPDVIEIREVNTPVPGHGEVRVRIRAVSLNASDWEFLTGQPLYARVFGLFKPRRHILGSDIAGVVDAVGSGVSRFTEGDEVFGDIMERMGGLAEYLCVPESLLTHKPAGLSFEQAAYLPQSGAIAMQGVPATDTNPGLRVLINGGGGGSGSLAIQLAKQAGCHVTAVDNAEKLELMRSLGADEVLDYRKVDYTDTGRAYDHILDLAAFRPFTHYLRCLAPHGEFLMVGGSVSLIFKLLLLGPFARFVYRRRLRLLAVRPNRGLDKLASWVDEGRVQLSIDKTFPLEQVPEALRYLGEGHARGKVVVTV